MKISTYVEDNDMSSEHLCRHVEEKKTVTIYLIKKQKTTKLCSNNLKNAYISKKKKMPM